MPPADAEIYYKMAVPGDPVTITGSPRAGVWDNGWTHVVPVLEAGTSRAARCTRPYEAGPRGSTFVSPASVPATSAAAPLGAPNPGNWTAS